MSNSRQSVSAVAAPDGRARAVVVPVVFLALAAWFLFEGGEYSSPVTPAAAVADWVTDTATVRHPSFKPETRIGVFDYRCSECHDMFESRAGARPSNLNQHRGIELKHGLNDSCYTCHDREQRDYYVDNVGNLIPPDQPQLLCAKCHGLVYRDWTHGVHGRTNGYWDETAGEVDRRQCTECHDPHVPPFPPMRPAPGPNTLRMGDQSSEGHGSEAHKNPLLVYRQAETPEHEDERELSENDTPGEHD